VRGLSHRQNHPWGGLLIASLANSLAQVARFGRAGLPAEGHSVRIARRCSQCPLHCSRAAAIGRVVGPLRVKSGRGHPRKCKDSIVDLHLGKHRGVEIWAAWEYWHCIEV